MNNSYQGEVFSPQVVMNERDTMYPLADIVIGIILI